MHKGIVKYSALLSTCMLLGAAVGTASAANTKWENPDIAGYGHVHPLPHAAVQPSKSRVYKAVFDVVQAPPKDKSKVDDGLAHVARAVNVFGSAGVPTSNMKFVAVIHGPATPIVLDNQKYRSHYGVDNPNLKLIRELRQKGVKVDVCGQALADNSFSHAWVDKDVTITLSALSDLTIYGDQGYAYLRE